MNDVNNMLFALLRSVLCGETLDKNLFQELNEETLGHLYKLSKSHDMAHVVGAALDNAGLLGDSKTAGKFAKQQLMAIYRYENQKHELDRICATLEESGIPFIPLKGSVIRDLYPEPWMRTSCDIDILVHENDVEKSKEILIEKLSFVYDGVHTNHDISLNSESGVHLELHYNIEGNDILTNECLSRVWDYAEPIKGLRYEMALRGEFVLFYCISHTMSHFLNGGCGIRTFADIWLIRRGLEYSVEEFETLCSKSELESFASGAICLSECWFSNAEKNKLLESFEEAVLAGGTYGTIDSNIVIKQEKAGSRVRYIISRLFASYPMLKTRYPELNNRALIPVYQVRRWIDMARGRRTKVAIHQLKISSKTDKKKSTQVRNLLTDLGLMERKSRWL